MASTFNKPATKGEVAVLKRKVAVLTRAARNVEFKNEDSAVSFNFDATGEVPATGQWIQGCVQGTGDSERIGNKITVKSIQFRGNILYSPATVATGTIVDMYIVLDRQCNGAAAAVTDVFTSANLSVALRNTTNLSRFQILWHGQYVLQPQTNNTAVTVVGAVVLPFSMYKKCNIPIKYDASAGAITDLTSNNIFLIAGSDGNSDDIVACVGTARLAFTDD